MSKKNLIMIVKLTRFMRGKVFNIKKLVVVFLLILSAFGVYSQTNEERSLQPQKEYVLNNGWLYGCIYQPQGKHTFCRIRLSDFKKEIFRNVSFIDGFVAVDNDQLFFSYHGLYKQRMDNLNRIPLKKVESKTSNVINNVIFFNNRLYYMQEIDGTTDKRKALYNICSMNTDGSDDKKLTGCHYRDFCIYKGMIFARNNESAEFEKLDINGNLMDNYGKVGYGYFFEVYNDYIYYLDKEQLYGININTKEKRLIKSSPFPLINPFISNNHLFFSTAKENVVNKNTNMSVGSYGDLYSINLASGELKRIYTGLCSLFYVYNGIIYCREAVVLSEVYVNEFQIKMDGTGKERVELFWKN